LQPEHPAFGDIALHPVFARKILHRTDNEVEISAKGSAGYLSEVMLA